MEKNKSLSNKIPIVLSSDNNYAMPMAVTIVSILENKNPESFYDFYILIPSSFNLINKLKLFLLKTKYKNFNFNFINMKDRFANFQLQLKHLSSAAYYRLIIPGILPLQYDKAIYLDVDIVVNVDLEELFNINLGENYLAGIKHPTYYFGDTVYCQYFQTIIKKGGIKDLSQYINSGVLLLNLDKIRKDNLQEKFIELIPREFPTDDQDIINTVCYDKILHIPFKYNVMPKCSSFLKDAKINEIYNLEEFKTAFENPSIIHWANPEKPWNSKNIMYSDYWFKYFKKSPFRNQKINLS